MASSATDLVIWCFHKVEPHSDLASDDTRRSTIAGYDGNVPYHERWSFPADLFLEIVLHFLEENVKQKVMRTLVVAAKSMEKKTVDRKIWKTWKKHENIIKHMKKHENNTWKKRAVFKGAGFWPKHSYSGGKPPPGIVGQRKTFQQTWKTWKETFKNQETSMRKKITHKKLLFRKCTFSRGKSNHMRITRTPEKENKCHERYTAMTRVGGWRIKKRLKTIQQWNRFRSKIEAKRA